MNLLSDLTANIHFTKTCNYHCRFCFAQYPDHATGLPLPLEKWKSIISSLAAHSLKRVNFVGGEPTLFLQDLRTMLEHAHRCGLETSIVTNGRRLRELLANPLHYPDMIGLSVDSARAEVNVALGRGKLQDRHASRSLEYADLVRERGIYLKLNTVVTSMNHEEDMGDYVLAFKPDRWKVLQLLKIEGQNDQSVEGLEVTRDQFERFIQRHIHLVHHGIPPTAETNDAMTESYLMVDPYGRFFDNSNGRQHYSDPIPEIGVDGALGQVRFSRTKFVERGGIVDLNSPERMIM
jgi:radical S-adenosyl methionine domain-containing protein 2